MRVVSTKVKVTAPNALGHDSTAYHQDFKIEERDVGHDKPHYGGYSHASYHVRVSDIGRIITVMTDGTGWTCWSFKT